MNTTGNSAVPMSAMNMVRIMLPLRGTRSLLITPPSKGPEVKEARKDRATCDAGTLRIASGRRLPRGRRAMSLAARPAGKCFAPPSRALWPLRHAYDCEQRLGLGRDGEPAGERVRFFG